MAKIIGYKNKLWRVIHDFQCINDDQPFTLPKGEYLFICKGGSGGYPYRDNPDVYHQVRIKSYGGVSYGVINLESEETFHAVVGGNGGDCHLLADNPQIVKGGFNGGSDGGKPVGTSWSAGCGGGGASDIRLLPYDPNEYPTYDQEGNFVEPSNPYVMLNSESPDQTGIPEGYTKYEELKVDMNNSSKVFINTEYFINDKTKVVTEIRRFRDSSGSYACLFGATSTSNNQYENFQFYTKYGRYDRMGVRYGSNQYTTVWAYPPTDQFVRITMSCDHVNVLNVKTNSNLWDASLSPSVQIPTGTIPMVIFGTNTNSSTDVFRPDDMENVNIMNSEYTPCRMKYFKIYENDVLLSNMVPCLESDTGKIGLYDTVREKFFPVYAQTGENINDIDVGPRYTRLEYLMPSQGLCQDGNYRGNTAFAIATNYIPNETTRVECDCVVFKRRRPDLYYAQMFGGRYSDNQRDFAFYSCFRHSDGNYYRPILKMFNATYMSDDPFIYNQRILLTVDTSKAQWFLNGVLKGTINVPSDATHVTFDQPISIFSGYEGGASAYGLDPSAFQLFEFKIYEGDTLVHDYVPCVSIWENVQCLYDKVTLTQLDSIQINPSYPVFIKNGPKLRSHPSIDSRIMVAGGGGGGAACDSNEYDRTSGKSIGGGTYAGPCDEEINYSGNGWLPANQSFGYSQGYAYPPIKAQYESTWSCEGYGGGGGGWYSGFTAQTTYRGSYANWTGGGGSGYVYTASSFKPPNYDPPAKYQFTDVTMLSGQSDHGEILICERITEYDLHDDDSIEFPCIGDVETLNMLPGKYRLTCYGGDGGYFVFPRQTSRGGFAQGVLNLSKQSQMFVRVGGTGYLWHNCSPYDNQNTHSFAITMMPFLAFNGGGTPHRTVDNSAQTAGGGATDIRFESDTLYHRVIVAGGGGGASSSTCRTFVNYYGSDGGGLTSGNFPFPSNDRYGNINGKSTQELAPSTYANVAGSFGYGGAGISYDDLYNYNSYPNCSSGGGGWFGGSGCQSTDSRGATGAHGGSGYVYTDSSYVVPGYQLDTSYQLTDAILTTGGNNLPYHMSKAVVDVLEISKAVIAKDEEGFKRFDSQTHQWVLLSPQPQRLTKEIFDQYYDSIYLSDEGLLNEYQLFVYDETDSIESFGIVCSLKKTTVVADTTMTSEVTNVYIDADEYDSSVYTVNTYAKRERDPVDQKLKVKVYIDIEKLQQSSEELKIYNVELTGKGGTQERTSYRYFTKEELTPALDCDPNNPCYGTLVHPNGEMEDYRDETGHIMTAQWLLPVKIGDSQLMKTEYLNTLYEAGTTDIQTVQSYLHNRLGYVVSCIRLNGTWYAQFSTINPMTKEVNLLFRKPASELTYYGRNEYIGIGGFLVDDNYFYFMISYSTRQDYDRRFLWRVDHRGQNYVSFEIPVSTVACSQICWFNEAHTKILMLLSDSRFCIFDTTTRTYETKNAAVSNMSTYDLICSDKYIAISIIESSRCKLMVYDKETFTQQCFLTLSTSTAYNGSACYHDKKFYVAAASGIWEINESDWSVVKHAFPIATSSAENYYVGKLIYVNGSLFVPGGNNSRWLYIYNIERDLFNMVYTAFQSTNLSNSSLKIPFNYRSFYVYPGGSSVMYMNYNGLAKYNFGYKYNQYLVEYNSSNVNHLHYDPGFANVTETCMIISDGVKYYPHEGSSATHIYGIDANKNDYMSAYGVKINYRAEDDEEGE